MQGKTYLTALYCVIRCILYPDTKICVASATLKQAVEVLKKITDDFCVSKEWGSDLLNKEIKRKAIGGQDPNILFHNGSIIYAVAANKNARSKRANCNIYDEFVQMDKDTIDTVLVPFLNAPRQPGYLSNKKYEHLVEPSKEFYLSSAWYKSTWGYRTVKDHLRGMIRGERYFSCSLPYQLSIRENLLTRERVENVMKKSDFSQIKFDMEFGCVWFGTNGDEFFSFDDISTGRKLLKPYPSLNKVLKNSKLVPELLFNEKRILSVDIALMASSRKKKNDASSFIINSAIPSSNNRYTANIVYLKNIEGMTTDKLAIEIMRHYYKFKCTDIAIDANGVGAGVYDLLIKDQIDPDTGETYPALTCINDKTMADRCLVKHAPEVMWAIKGAAAFNTQIATGLRDAFKQGKINLLVSEYDCDSYLIDNIKDYDKLSEIEQLNIKLPYVETTLLINEMINLQHEIKGIEIKLKEKSGMRKDRYSSLAYNFWVMKQHEVKLKTKINKPRVPIMSIRKPRLYKI